ncbi:MFS transporter [Klebsiella michiganensis]|uniref:MFS transporter n=1 Tax=Klebsiella michiganensis TaxID=1134687 RepID=UPI003970AE68
MSLDATIEKKKGVPTRYLILLIIFIVTAVNYADRATFPNAGTEVAKELPLSAVSMSYIFSAFGWAYLLMRLSGGWLLDKFGSKNVYSCSLFFWSLFTFLQGFVDMFPLVWAGLSMFFMRFMLGFSETPFCPANARIMAAWFPTKERGTASAIVNFAQYFSLALFSPLLGWLTFAWGWEHVFTVMGYVLTGLYGGVFNVFSNIASIVTPLVIGYLVSELYSFNAALVFAGCSALMAMICYLFVVGDIKRMELQKSLTVK